MMSTQSSEPVWVSQIGPSPSSQRPSTTNPLSAAWSICHLRRARPIADGRCRHPATALRSANANHEGRDAHRGQRLEELAVRPGRHRRGHPRLSARARSTASRRPSRPRSRSSRDAYLGLDPPRRRAAAPADGPRRLLRRRPDPHGGRRRDRGRLLGHRRQGGRAAGPRAPRRPVPRPRPRLRQRLVPDRRARRRPSRSRPATVVAARLHGAQVRPVRGRVAGPGPPRGGPLDRHRARGARRGRPGRRPDDRGPQPLQRVDGAADRRPAGRVPAGLVRGAGPPLSSIGSMVEVARRSPVPIATGESFTSLGPVRRPAVARRRPHPPARAAYLGGLWRTRQVAAMADAHFAVVAPHNAQGPVCGAIAVQLGACIPNFYVQEIVRRVQRRLDARHRRPARPPGGRVRRGARRAGPRHRPRLGRAGRASVPAAAPHPAVQPRLGAPRRRAGRDGVDPQRSGDAGRLRAGRAHRGAGRRGPRRRRRARPDPRRARTGPRQPHRRAHRLQPRVRAAGRHRPRDPDRLPADRRRPRRARPGSTDGERDGFDLETDRPRSGTWLDYVAGTAWALGEAGHPRQGLRGVIASTAPDRMPACRPRQRSSWRRHGPCSTRPRRRSTR